MSVSEGMKKYNTKNYFVRLINLQDEEAKQTKTKIQPWTRVYELKTKIGKECGVSNKNVRLFFCNIEMIDDLTMLDYKVIDYRHPEIFFQISSNLATNTDIKIEIYGAFPCPPILKKLIEEIRHGFMEGLIPNLILEGTSGTYSLRNTNKDTVGLFKPIDEEAFAPNNQKGYTGKFGQESFRKGVLSGEGSIREVAAYILDTANFFSVPETTFVEITHPIFNKNINDLFSIDDDSMGKMRNSIIHSFVLENLVSRDVLVGNSTMKRGRINSVINPTQFNKLNVNTCSNINGVVSNNKIVTHAGDFKDNLIKKKYGSIQRFMKSNDIAANYSNSLFGVDEVHKMGVLDIRILNCDRNDENILVVKKRDKSTGKSFYRLVPIDHSLSFPDCIKIQEYEMVWMSWDQSQKPFSKDMLKYIDKINIEEDIKRMRQVIKLRENCWKNFRISNTILKIAAKKGLTLFQIGSIIYKPGYDEDTLSELEILMEKTEKICCLYIEANNEILNKIAFQHNYFEDDNYETFKNSKKNIANINSNSIFVEEKTLIGLNEDEKENIENKHEISQDPRYKKRHSLLKRTASEPKLIEKESNEISTGLYKETESDIANTVGKLENLMTLEKNSNNLRKTSNHQKNFGPRTNNYKFEESNTSFDEIFFYHFENILVEFLDKKYNLK